MSKLGLGVFHAGSWAVLLCLCSSLSGQSSSAPVLEVGDEIRAEIDDRSATVTTPRIEALYNDAPVLGQSYRVQVKKSGTYYFDLRSAVFDSFLVLRSGEAKIVGEDDDGLAAVHARLVVELEADTPYELDACALHGGRGAFDLRMGKGEPDPNENTEWSDEEIDVRIQTVFEEDDWKKVDVVKSKRYLIFTNSSAGKKFGKILDKDIFEGFRKEFGFKDPKIERRMPIYLFGTREDYIRFLQANLGMSEAQAKQTGGIQYRDYYSTSYNSPRDPVHFHECAHQIMSNVLGLGGGGSWYQEGVASYYEDKIKKFNRHSETRMLIRTDQSVSWRELLGAPSMLFSAGENKKGAGGGRGNYGQAASIIQFFKDGPRKKQFQEFLFTIGKVPRSDLEALEAAFQSIYGVGIEELEAEWLEYFAG